MSRKKKGYGDIINEYYDKKRISNKVRRIKVDENRLSKALLRSDIEDYTADIYDKFDMTRYENHKDFVLQKRSSYPNIPDNKLEEMWQDYLHRDKLIKSGQYEEWRYAQFRENYLKAMRNSAFSTEAIRNVENLSMEDWKNIILVPNPNKNNAKDTLFPKLGGFHYGRIASKFTEEATKEIIAAFSTIGVKYVSMSKEELEDKKNEISKILKTKSNIKDDVETAYNLDNVIRILPASDKEKVREDTVRRRTINKNVDINDEIISVGLTIPSQRIKTSKSGNRYIPFVGSTRKGTKNEDFVKAILLAHDIYNQ